MEIENILLDINLFQFKGEKTPPKDLAFPVKINYTERQNVITARAVQFTTLYFVYLNYIQIDVSSNEKARYSKHFQKKTK